LPVIYYTYIIQSLRSARWYYGFTNEPTYRLDAHNSGLNKSTANRGPWKFIFLRPFNSKHEARLFEIHLKKSRNKEYIRSRFAEFFIDS